MRKSSRFWAVVLSASLAWHIQAALPPPVPGAVQTLPVMTIALNVGSTEKESRRVVYAPPPGWHIRSHRVECTTKTGLASYTVNTVPADWAWSSDDSSAEGASAKAEAGAHLPGTGGQAKAITESRKTTAEHQRTVASHHALVVDATARGSGWLRGGATLELKVFAELVYDGLPATAGPTRAASQAASRR